MKVIHISKSIYLSKLLTNYPLNNFSSIFRKNFQEKVFNKNYSSIKEIFDQVNQFQKIGWRLYQPDMRQLKSGKFYKILQKFDKRVKRILFKKQKRQNSKQNQQFVQDSQQFLSKQLKKNSLNQILIYQNVFNEYPKHKFSIAESYIYFFFYYTQIIKNYEEYAEYSHNQTQSDFISRFSSPTFKLQSLNYQNIKNLFFKSLPILLKNQQIYDLQYFCKVLAFGAPTPQLLNLEKTVVNKFFINYKIARAFYLYLDRFHCLQDKISKFVFKDYDIFRQETSSFLFKKQKKYKGDYEFQINEQSVFGINKQNTKYIQTIKIKQICNILQIVGKFGCLSDKYLICAQLLVKNYWDKLELIGKTNFSKALKVIAIGGRTMKVLDQNIVQLYQSMIKKHQMLCQEQNQQLKMQQMYSLLCYCCQADIQNHYIINQIFNKMSQILQSKTHKIQNKIKFNLQFYSVDWFLYIFVKTILKWKFNQDLTRYIEVINEQKSIKSMENQNIKIFLDKFHYNYSVLICPITHLSYFKFFAPNENQQKHLYQNEQKVQYKTLLFPLPSTFYNPNVTTFNIETKSQNVIQDKIQITPLNIVDFYKVEYKNNGLYKLFMKIVTTQDLLESNQIFEYKNKVFKTINLAQFQTLKTKGEKDQLVKSKIKGIKKEKIAKVKLFDF